MAASQHVKDDQLLEQVHCNLVRLEAVAHAAYEALDGAPLGTNAESRRARDRLDSLVGLVAEEAAGALERLAEGIQASVEARRAPAARRRAR